MLTTEIEFRSNQPLFSTRLSEITVDVASNLLSWVPHLIQNLMVGKEKCLEMFHCYYSEML